MDNVVLLSEIHPSGLEFFNPLHQAHAWYGLFSANDIDNLLSKGGLGFLEGIALIQERCMEQNKTLVLRDWTHLDYAAVPFLPKATYRLTLADVLRTQNPVINTATVRHPIDQWLSLRRLPLIQGKLTLKSFLRGYRQFAESCTQIGFVRYEDFVSNPDVQLRILCERLSLNYDDGWQSRWSTYTKITGDTGGRCDPVIKPRPRAQLELNLIDACARNADYRHSLELLGYTHPS